MKKIGIVLLLILSVTFISCKQDTETKEKQPEETKTEEFKEVKPIIVEIILESKNNSDAKGKFKFTYSNGSLNIFSKFWDFNPGTHGIRINEIANSNSKLDETKESQKKDIGYFRVGDKGIGAFKLDTNLWCIDCKDESKNIRGKEIIIHQISEEQVTKPSNTTITHISCGGIIK